MTERDTLDHPVRQDGDPDCTCARLFDRLHPGHPMRAALIGTVQVRQTGRAAWDTDTRTCPSCDGHGWLARCWRCSRLATPGRKGHWEPHACWTCWNAVAAMTAQR